MRRLIALILSLVFLTVPAAQARDRATVLEFARKGWVYQLRSALVRPRGDAPPVQINGRLLAHAPICLLGEAPHPRTTRILQGFSALIADIYGRPPVLFRAATARECGRAPSVHLRLYSRALPLEELGDDMRVLDEAVGIGFSERQRFHVLSPAQAQTFFGARGNATHILVRQPSKARLTPLEERFYGSILLEELYQAYSFGMDILHLDGAMPFVSKLEERPVDLRAWTWDSPDFMMGMLRVNPPGLCRFDVFMMHAVAAAPLPRTNDDAFLAFIDGAFDDLNLRTDATFRRLARSGILDPNCRPWPVAGSR